MKRSSWCVISLSAWLLLIQPVFGKSKGKTGFIESAVTVTPAIDQLFYVVLWITGIVFVLVYGSILISLFRSKQSRPGTAYTPASSMIEIIWTAVPVVIFICLAIFNTSVSPQISGTPATSDIEVEQFAWNVRYSEVAGKASNNDKSLEGRHP